MSWSARMVSTLAESKRAGVPFDMAWKQALRLHPPRRSDLGEREPQLFGGELSVVEHLRAACEDAWCGRKPVLAHLPVVLAQMEAWDGSPITHRAGRRSAGRGAVVA